MFFEGREIVVGDRFVHWDVGLVFRVEYIDNEHGNYETFHVKYVSDVDPDMQRPYDYKIGAENWMTGAFFNHNCAARVDHDLAELIAGYAV